MRMFATSLALSSGRSVFSKTYLQQSLRPFRFPLQGTETFLTLKEGSYKIIPSFFTIKEGSTSHLGLLQWSLHPLRFPRLRGTETSGKKRKTALRCSEPLRYKVGGPKRSAPCCAGWDRLGNSRLQFTVNSLQFTDFCGNLLMSCRFLSIFLVVSRKKCTFAVRY